MNQYHRIIITDPPHSSLGSVQSFLWSCLKLMRNEQAIRELQRIIDQYLPSSSVSSAQRAVHSIMGHTRIGREMRLIAQVGEFEMDEVFLDLGSEVNVLTKQTWEQMGSPKLARSPIHLRLANQQRVSPLGRLPQVPVDIDGVRSFVELKS